MFGDASIAPVSPLRIPQHDLDGPPLVGVGAVEAVRLVGAGREQQGVALAAVEGVALIVAGLWLMAGADARWSRLPPPSSSCCFLRVALGLRL